VRPDPLPTTAATGTVLDVRAPLVSGDPVGVTRLAAAYEDLAAVVAATVRDALHVLTGLDGNWIGQAAQAVSGPATALDETAAAMVTSLERTSSELSAYAHQLAQAQEHHGWSIGRLAALGATIAVSAGVVVATLGAASAIAGAADAAVAADAAADAGAAAAAADTAAEATATELTSSMRALTDVRAMSRFVLPHIASGEVDAGVTASLQQLRGGRMDWSQVLGAGSAGLAGSATAEELRMGVAPLLSAAPTVLRATAPHLVEAGAWGAAGGAQDLFAGGPIRPLDVVTGAVTGGATSAGRQSVGIWQDSRAAAAATPQAQAARISARLLSGHPDLDLHESRGGHVIARHVGLDVPLQARLSGRHRIEFASTFHRRDIAEGAISQTLLDNRRVLADWLGGRAPRLQISGRYRDGSAGIVRWRGSTVATTVERVVVVLDRPGGIPRIRTAYPVFTAPPRLRS
jgi:uncharacterized protein YukE